MRRFLFNSCLFFLMISHAFSQSDQILDRIVAKVGDEPILQSDLEQQMAYESERKGVLPENAYCFILEQMLGQKLLVNQSKLDSIIVSDEEVNQQLNSRIEYILNLMNNDFRQFEEYYGKTVSEVRREMRSELRDQLLAERMQQKVIENTEITPSEVREFFNKIPTDSLPYFNAEVEIGEILYNPITNPEQKQKAREQLEAIRKRIIDDGESFESLATTFSDDLGSARVGGDLGLQRRGTFVPEFEAVAFNLEVDEISPIIETEFGYHIIQLLERRGNLIHVRHILVKPEVTEEDLKKAERKLREIRDMIEKDSISFEYAVKEYSDKNAQSYNNSGRMINPITGNTFFETGDLDPDIFFAIDTLEVGQISNPIQFRRPSGDVAYRIVQLQSRTDPHRADLRKDYTKIKNAAIDERKSEYLNVWLEDKIDSTFIEIEPSFLQSCKNLIRWSKKMVEP